MIIIFIGYVEGLIFYVEGLVGVKIEGLLLKLLFISLGFKGIL